MTAVAAAAHRGRLVVSRRVVERIVSQAASEPALTGGVSGGILGFGTSADLAARPAAAVELVGSTATVALQVTVAYPTPIRATTERLRRHVVERVLELAGVHVSRVDITVAALQPATTGRRLL